MKIEEIKRNLNKIVHYKDSRNNIDSDYLFTGCILRRGKNGFYYQAELQDMKSERTILICKLDDVQAVGSEVEK